MCGPTAATRLGRVQSIADARLAPRRRSGEALKTAVFSESTISIYSRPICISNLYTLPPRVYTTPARSHYSILSAGKRLPARAGQETDSKGTEHSPLVGGECSTWLCVGGPPHAPHLRPTTRATNGSWIKGRGAEGSSDQAIIDSLDRHMQAPRVVPVTPTGAHAHVHVEALCALWCGRRSARRSSALKPTLCPKRATASCR